ncbi:MAG TPA: bifunctional adenosylcobinamide kinase/adenosylcobinamide-phosphate guanylyltransferase [Limnobacter sp.]|nr:bifunctional adenosylcobinamide kinase/adenosylcobinamide-phosphate guanylyltransferase [Limnobacter sp.]
MHMLARSELILGGQRSGKSRRAENLAIQWLEADPKRQAVLVATAHVGDDEMRQRIVQHQLDRAQRVPRLVVVEESLYLPATLKLHSTSNTLLIVDCLTLWLVNWLMPPPGVSAPVQGFQHTVDHLVHTLHNLPGPVVLVSNEIGLGVVPMGKEVRHYVDELGRLNQTMADACERLTWMVAGQALYVKGAPA